LITWGNRGRDRRAVAPPWFHTTDRLARATATAGPPRRRNHAFDE
jgi:hypothetical protein